MASSTMLEPCVRGAMCKKEGYPERKGTEEREEEYERDKQGEKRKWKVYMTNYTGEKESPKCMLQ